MGWFGKEPSLWRRMTDGLALGELWSRFKSETRSSYGLYATRMDSDAFRRLPGWHKAVRIGIALFWQLSAPRRIALLLALVVVLDGAQRREQGQVVAGALLLLFLLGLELADRLAMKRDLEIAREIQGWLVPKTPPHIQGLDIAFVTRPANTVSGDYYDAFLRPAPPGSPTGQRLLIVVADVAGKSVPAALLMATFQASLHTLAVDDLPLPELIARLNRYTSAHSFGGLRFTTAFMAELELDTGNLAFVNAGHNAPFLMRAGGNVERLVVGGLPLGIESAEAYESGRVPLHAGDRLVVFSDGLVESQNRDEAEYGEERLLEVLASTAGLSAQEELNRILDSVDEFVRKAPRFDDTTCLVLHKGPKQGEVNPPVVGRK
jgi:phosphoserine phosphatase RsbU/P